MKALFAFVFAVLGVLSGPARADFPERPLKLVVPYLPGGSSDAFARTLAKAMERELGQPVIVENKPGANTSIASTAVARGAADGYTLLLASSASIVLNPLLYPKLAYSPERDFKLLALLAEVPLVLVTNDKVGTKTLSEFAAYARANAGRVNYASVGLGNPLQLATELLKSELKFDATHIPYNGSATALTSLMAGDTQLMLDIVGTSLPHILSGKLKALAVTGDRRLKVLPDVPTVAEKEVPGFRAATWFGLVTHSGTPAPIAAKLQVTIRSIMRSEEFKALVEAQTLVEQPQRSDQEIAAYVARDRDTWGKVIRSRNIVLE